MNILDQTINSPEVKDIQECELHTVTGGGFAYDLAFLLRETWVYASNGGSIFGTRAIAIDLAMNYRPR